jgi:dolichol-phosphate mannosyltransferase
MDRSADDDLSFRTPKEAGDDGQRLLVTLCTYNERENLAALVREIHAAAADADVLVIDDNSPDGTGRLADELAAADPRVHVLHRPGKGGLGAATVAGFRWGIERGYGWLINMDADFSHHPRYLPALREAAAGADGADVAIGSRYVPGGAVEGWGPLRHVMSRGVNWYARLLLRLPTRDNSGSFRCYRVSKLAEIDLSRVRSKGYAFQEEILYRCRRAGCRFREVPITFEDRRHGQSKINTREVCRALWDILHLGVENARK